MNTDFIRKLYVHFQLLNKGSTHNFWTSRSDFNHPDPATTLTVQGFACFQSTGKYKSNQGAAAPRVRL